MKERKVRKLMCLFRTYKTCKMNKNSIYNSSMYQMRIINKQKSWMKMPNLNILMTKYNNRIVGMQLFKLQLNSI